MEDKQLNFNQPLLSVRRFSSTAASTEVGCRRKNDSSFSSIPPLPTYKSELKSGPLRNPGAVPFIWEQTPGRPKDKSKPRTRDPELPLTAPKLPPGRNLDTKQRPSDKVSKYPIVAGAQNPSILSNPQSVSSSLDENVSKVHNFKDGVEDKGSSGSEDGDAAYLDALDTLSRSESFFLNCSVSGLSELDGSDVKTSGTFSTDPQTRDFMMGRFLPAAKAMASETPPFASRRLPVAQVQPAQVKKEVSRNRRPPPHQYGPNAHCAHAKGRGESEDEEDDYGETELLSGKVCGLFPRFGLANSFCLTNPVLGMGVQTRVPSSSLQAARAGFSYRDAKKITENKPSRNAVDEKRSGGIQRRKLQELREEEENGNKKASHKNESEKPDGLSLYMRLQGGGVLPYRSDSLLSHFHEEKGFHGICEKPTSLGLDGFGSDQSGPKCFRELLASSPERESGLESPAIEKTLYIDTEHTIEPRNSNSSCSDMKWLSDLKSDSEIIGKSRIPTADSSVQDIKQLSIAVEEGKSQQKILDSVDSNILSSFVKSDEGVQMKQRKALRRPDPVLGSITLDDTEVVDNRNLDEENHWPSEANSLENFHNSNSEFHLPPPLPKSPSESWLSRTLPSVSAKNPQTHFGNWMNPRNGASKTSSPDPKWETIVKTYNARQGHLQFSQTLLASVPES